MRCCGHGACYFVSSVFLLLGGAGIVFGLACGFWFSGESLILICSGDSLSSCELRDDINGGIWIGQIVLLCAGVLFAFAAFIVMFMMCCCCHDRSGTMFTLKFFFMLLSGGAAGVCVVWFALNVFGFGFKAWDSFEEFSDDPHGTYGYYVECAGAGIMLLGSIFAILGRCCCDNRD